MTEKTDEQTIYRNILESLEEGVITIDLRGVILTLNEAAETMLGLKAGFVKGRPFKEVFPALPENDDFIRAMTDGVHDPVNLQNKRLTYNREGAGLVLRATASFLKVPGEGLERDLGVTIVLHDITELEALQTAEAKLTEELKEQHQELQSAYLNLEKTSKHLDLVLKKAHIVRIAATAFVILLFVALGVYLWTRGIPLERGAFHRGHDKSGRETYTVTPGTLKATIALKGSLRPINVINIVSPFNGKVKGRYFHYGESVAKGTLLLRMDKSDIEVKYREANVAYMKALARKKEMDEWSGGDDVTKARRSVTKSKMSLDSAKQRFEQTEELFKKGIVSAEEYHNDRQSFESAKMDCEAAERELKTTLAKGQGDHLRAAELELENARTQLRALEAQVKAADVYAPVSGTILVPGDASAKEKQGKTAEKGVTFSQGDLMLVIGDSEGWGMTVKVDETEVLRVKTGQQAAVTGDAFPDVHAKGVVTQVSSEATREGGGDGQGTPMYNVSIAIRNLTADDLKKLRVGMSAKVEIVVLAKTDAITVPIGAVLEKGDGSYVLLREKSSNEPVQVKVQTGITTIDSVEILKGLKAGDEILARP